MYCCVETLILYFTRLFSRDSSYTSRATLASACDGFECFELLGTILKMRHNSSESNTHLMEELEEYIRDRSEVCERHGRKTKLATASKSFDVMNGISVLCVSRLSYNNDIRIDIFCPSHSEFSVSVRALTIN